MRKALFATAFCMALINSANAADSKAPMRTWYTHASAEVTNKHVSFGLGPVYRTRNDVFHSLQLVIGATDPFNAFSHGQRVRVSSDNLFGLRYGVIW